MYWEVFEFPNLDNSDETSSSSSDTLAGNNPLIYSHPDIFDEDYCDYRDSRWVAMVDKIAELPDIILEPPQLQYRNLLVKRLCFITKTLGYSTDTLHLTVSQFDRFLDVNNLSYDKMVHVGLACLSLVAKSQEKTKKPPSVKMLTLVGGVELDPIKFLLLEWSVATNGRWRQKLPTPVTFASFLSQYVVTDGEVTKREPRFVPLIKDEGARLLDAYLNLSLLAQGTSNSSSSSGDDAPVDVRLRAVRGDYVGAACVSCARTELGLAAWPPWLAALTGLAVETIEPFFRFLLRVMQNVRDGDSLTQDVVEPNKPVWWPLDIDKIPPNPQITQDAPEHLQYLGLQQVSHYELDPEVLPSAIEMSRRSPYNPEYQERDASQVSLLSQGLYQGQQIPELFEPRGQQVRPETFYRQAIPELMEIERGPQLLQEMLQEKDIPDLIEIPELKLPIRQQIPELIELPRRLRVPELIKIPREVPQNIPQLIEISQIQQVFKNAEIARKQQIPPLIEISRPQPPPEPAVITLDQVPGLLAIAREEKKQKAHLVELHKQAEEFDLSTSHLVEWESPNRQPTGWESPKRQPAEWESPESPPTECESPKRQPTEWESPKRQPAEWESPESPPTECESPKRQPTEWESPKRQPAEWESPESPPMQWESPKRQPTEWESPKRQPTEGESPKRQPAGCESPKRQPTEWESPKRQPTEWESPKRQPTEWESPKMQPTERESPKMQPTERESPKRQSVGWESPKRQPTDGESPKKQPAGLESPKRQSSGWESPKRQSSGWESPKRQPALWASPKRQPSGWESPKSQSALWESSKRQPSGWESPKRQPALWEAPERLSTVPRNLPPFPGYENSSFLQRPVDRDDMVLANPTGTSMDSVYDLCTPSTSTGLGRHRGLPQVALAIYSGRRSGYMGYAPRPQISLDTAYEGARDPPNRVNVKRPLDMDGEPEAKRSRDTPDIPN